MRPAILIMGPTASGKSALALDLAARFCGEIVSVDSAQVFRGMDIGTAKPDAPTRAFVPHHLIDILSPTQRYSAAEFARDALRAIDDIRARGRVPLLAGGTMLYFKALMEGLSELPPADAQARADIDTRAARAGWPAMHAELAKVDPALAQRLAPTDAQRIQRGLEVWQLTGRPLSLLQGRRMQQTLGPTVTVALIPERARLHAAIATRFDAMLAAGLVDELRALKHRYVLDRDLPSMRTVGYRQAWDFLTGAIGAEALRERGIAATRQLAKRQYTWLRAMPVTAYDAHAPETPAQITERIERALA